MVSEAERLRERAARPRSLPALRCLSAGKSYEAVTTPQAMRSPAAPDGCDS